MPTQIAKVFNGTIWVAKPVKIYDGTTWVEKQVKTWSGSAWLPVAYFVQDTFTDTSNTLLSSHTGEIGATWTKHSSETGTCNISNANRARWGGTSTSQYYASGVPPTAEYSVSVDIFVKSNFGSAGITARISTSVQTFYMARYDSGSWQLYKCVSGSFTLLGSYSQTLSVSSTYVMKFDCRDATKKIFIDGVERISSTDNAITATGRVGIRFANGTDTTGYHTDNLTAVGL